jgi:hypothetical protein
VTPSRPGRTAVLSNGMVNLPVTTRLLCELVRSSLKSGAAAQPGVEVSALS